jgi:hypothetical protein
MYQTKHILSSVQDPSTFAPRVSTMIAQNQDVVSKQW